MSTLERPLLHTRTPNHTFSGGSHTPTHDVSNYCTLSRKASKKKKLLDRKHSGSSDDLLTGTRVSKVPELEEYTVKVGLVLVELF